MVLISTNGISSQKWLFPVSMSHLRGSFNCLLPLWEALQDQQVTMTWASFKLLLLPIMII